MNVRIVIAGIACVLAGCASEHHYANNYEKNLTIDLKLDDGAGSSVEAYAGINEIAADCTSHYHGHVTLVPGPNRIGLAPGKPAYVVVEISHSSFLKGKDHASYSRGTLITPTAGKRYEVTAHYADEMFNLRVYERGPSARKEIPLTPAAAGCKRAR